MSASEGCDSRNQHTVFTGEWQRGRKKERREERILVDSYLKVICKCQIDEDWILQIDYANIV